jgi:hypothetical protein
MSVFYDLCIILTQLYHLRDDVLSHYLQFTVKGNGNDAGSGQGKFEGTAPEFAQEA